MTYTTYMPHAPTLKPPLTGQETMGFGTTTKILAKRMLKEHRLLGTDEEPGQDLASKEDQQQQPLLLISSAEPHWRDAFISCMTCLSEQHLADEQVVAAGWVPGSRKPTLT